MNLDPGGGAAHFGLMHLVATNVVIWAKTVIKESLLEYHEINEEKNHLQILNHSLELENTHIVKRESEENININHCGHENEDFDQIHSILRASTPILFAFIIEFTLIGATVFYNMWHHIEPHHKADQTFDKMPKIPNAKNLIQKTDWSHSTFGAIAGVVMFIFNITALGAFFHWSSNDSYLDEYLEKIMRSLTNSLGIFAAIFGCMQVKKMVRREDQENFSVDIFLLNLGGAFTFVYMSLSIYIGTTQSHDETFPSSLLIVNGVLSICQIITQIVFINLILEHVIKKNDFSHPGRQMTTFLVVINFSLWFVNTFELQKSQASQVEAEIYGAVTWVWLQRLTLPIVIFFRL